jgi:hypothetical protein
VTRCALGSTNNDPGTEGDRRATGRFIEFAMGSKPGGPFKRVDTANAAVASRDVFDDVTVRVSDLDRARSFYESALATLAFGAPHQGDHFFDWRDLWVGQARDDRPVTQHVHIGLAAPSREHVDEFWRTLTEQGFGDDGPPGLREKYRSGYTAPLCSTPIDRTP